MGDPTTPQQENTAPIRKKYVRAVGPRLRIVLNIIWVLLAVLGANSVYLLSVTFLDWMERTKGVSYQNYFYQIQFLVHLVLGLLFIVPFLFFNIVHIRNTWNRPNRRAVGVGYFLFASSIIVLVSGIVLVRFDGLELLQVKNPTSRGAAYWAHVIAPLACVWLYILHRLAGPRIRWKTGIVYAGGVAAAVAAMIALHRHDPRVWTAKAPKDGDKYFTPSSSRTANGKFISAKAIMNDDYCLQCHQDAYKGWFHSAHHFSSFNNPFYLFTIKQTREVALRRDGSVQMSRWCAGCHDPAPFFSGAFDDPNFDMEKHPTAKAGITCVTCHSITSLEGGARGPTGNGNYTIEEPILYPFTFSPTNSLLFWVNKQLVKGKPQFHKQTFLKPLHKSAEFCSTCHKVGLPMEVNHYKEFLRGQNHYDAYLLSGVSGIGARSFYYPPVAQPNCSGCHMPLQKSEDFAARIYGTNTDLAIHNHLFPSANTALAYVRGATNIVKAHQDFLKDSVRVDLFGVKEGGTIDAPLVAPLRPNVPKLKPGKTYLVETVIRTLKLGHLLTQGTVDSNELWAEASVTDMSGKKLGGSGNLGRYNEVDPWAHFFNVYMLDRDGNRVDRRNAQDIFVPLYNNQIPPGAATVLHYRLTVPADQKEPLKMTVKVNYRKFDAIYYNYVNGRDYSNGAPFQVTNDLPITLMASDTLTFAVEGGNELSQTNNASGVPPWQRWNDYGIGLFLKGDKGSEKGELIQAADAFSHVEKLGRADGPLNLARVFFKEGRLEDAVVALQRANDTNRFTPAGNRWTIAWLNGQVNKQNGFLDQAIKEFTSILEDRYPELEQRGFNFSRDYEVINELGQTLFERAKMERSDPARKREYLDAASRRFRDTLQIDPENVAAHYNLSLIYQELGDKDKAAEHRKAHERYRVDDNARDRAVGIARRQNAAADHASQAIVIYDLQRSLMLGSRVSLDASGVVSKR
ncbi:MAG TPA: multiheme c-type cytochrome [Candidatus Limnocylindria bacterium]|nr:multiheme c-type cytochrome [Candidatus Limnocylindria bacterium]